MDEQKFDRGRRKFMVGALAAGAAAGVGLGRRVAWADTSKPVKIGAVITTTGSHAQEGIDNLNGMKLCIDELGGKFGGRPIELIVEDDEFKPQVGLQKTRKLVESDGVDIVVGPLSSAVGLAMSNYIRHTKTIWVISGAGLAALTRAKKGPLIMRTSTSTWQTNAPIGRWAPAHLGKHVMLAASDYAGGHDTMAEFKGPFEEAGGKVAGEVYAPLGTVDFSPYLAKIKEAKPQFVYCFFAGADGLNFIKQYDQFGLKSNIPLSAAGFAVASDILKEVGKPSLGIVSCLHYTNTLDNPANKRFVAQFKAKHNELPTFGAEYGYVAARTIAEGLKAAGGETSDKEKLMKALLATSFDAPRGPVKFDPVTHNVIMNEYIRKVAMVDGRPANVVVETIPNTRDPG